MEDELEFNEDEVSLKGRNIWKVPRGRMLCLKVAMFLQQVLPKRRVLMAEKGLLQSVPVVIEMEEQENNVGRSNRKWNSTIPDQR